MAKSRQYDGIFAKADYHNLVEARRTLNEMHTTMDKAEQCGVSCAVWRQQVAQIDHDLANIQQHFMTPAPTA